MEYRVYVTTKNGKQYSGPWLADESEAEGWEFILTSTEEPPNIVMLQYLDEADREATYYFPWEWIASVCIEKRKGVE